MPNKNLNFTITAKDNMSPVMRGAQNTIDRFKKDAATGFGLAGGMSIFNTAKMAIGFAVDQVQNMIKASRDLTEQQTKTDAVFRESSKSVREFAAGAARSYGLSERAALQGAAAIGNLLEAIGETPAAAARMSISLTKLAADFASFNNQPTEEVLRALNAALVGEAEPARRLGINISMARVEAYAFAHGIAKAKSALTDNQKVMARYAIILEDSKNAQGDFARTSGNLANAQRILDAEVENLNASWGGFMAGPATVITKWAIDFIDILDGMGPAAKNAAEETISALGEIKGAIQPPSPSAQGTGLQSSPAYWWSTVIQNLPGNEDIQKIVQFGDSNKAVLDALKISWDDYVNLVGTIQQRTGATTEEALTQLQKTLNATSTSVELNSAAVFGSGVQVKSAAMQWAEGNNSLAKSGLSAAAAMLKYNSVLSKIKSSQKPGATIGMPIAVSPPSADDLRKQAIASADSWMNAYVNGLRAAKESSQIAQIITESGTSGQAAADYAAKQQAMKNYQAFNQWLRYKQSDAVDWEHMGSEAALGYVRGFGTSFKDQMKAFKDDVRNMAMDIQWELNHPQSKEHYITWIEAQIRRTNRQAHRARQEGNTEALADIRALRTELKLELDRIDALGATVSFDARVNDHSGQHYVPGRGWVDDKKAGGGPVYAGGTYLVGERGPEILQMGNSNGNIIPNHQIGGSPIVVNIDGQRLFEIVNKRLGRAVAMGV